MATGIPAQELSDADLRRELLQLKTKQQEIQAGGTPDQKSNHASRTSELEEEFLKRFSPERQQPEDEVRTPTDDVTAVEPPVSSPDAEEGRPSGQ
jgi:hypothetical protein